MTPDCTHVRFTAIVDGTTITQVVPVDAYDVMLRRWYRLGRNVVVTPI